MVLDFTHCSSHDVNRGLGQFGDGLPVVKYGEGTVFAPTGSTSRFDDLRKLDQVPRAYARTLARIVGWYSTVASMIAVRYPATRKPPALAVVQSATSAVKEFTLSGFIGSMVYDPRVELQPLDQSSFGESCVSSRLPSSMSTSGGMSAICDSTTTL